MRRILFNTVIVFTIALILSGSSNTSYAQNTLSIENKQYPYGTTEITVNIILTNADSVWGFQFDVIDIPDVLSGFSVSSPLEDLGLLIYGNDNGSVYRVLMINPSLDMIPPGPQQSIATIEYTVEENFEGIITLDFTEVQLADNNGNLLEVIISKGSIPIGGMGTFGDGSEREFSPDLFMLAQNSPNPFNSQTTISFGLPENTWVTVYIYNVLGQEIETLIDSEMNAGYHTFIWDSRSNQSGIYFYTLKADDFQATKRMLLLK